MLLRVIHETNCTDCFSTEGLGIVLARIIFFEFKINFKGWYNAPLYNMYNKSLLSAECICEVLAQNTPCIIFYSMLKLPIYEDK